VSVCANCGAGIIRMNTLSTWIHPHTGRAACGILRARLLVAISGRREARAAPSRRPGSTLRRRQHAIRRTCGARPAADYLPPLDLHSKCPY
jgi:hypothetical protein